MSISCIEFDARELLGRSLQTTDLHDSRELSQVCGLFRLPLPDANINGEQICMPGAYSVPRMADAPRLIPTERVHGNRQSILQRVMGSIFSSKELDNTSGTEKLPNNILKRIFVFAHANEFLLHGSLTLINVSKRWRATAFTVPTLWESLDMAYGNPTNPFYTIIYYICHTKEFRLFVHSPAILAALTTLNAVIPPNIRPKIQLVQLNSLTLLGFGAIEAINSFPFDYPRLTRLMLINVRWRFPINLLTNCPALEVLTIDFEVEIVHGRFLNEELPHCPIVCTLLDITWSAKWAPFKTTYENNLSIFHLKTFVYSFVENNGFFNSPPFSLLARNLDIENLILRGVSFADMEYEAIAASESPGSYPPLTDLWQLTRLELSEVDQVTTLFRLCTQFPTRYFPRLASLYLTRVTLDLDVLMAFIRMKTRRSDLIPSDVSRLRILSLEGILFDEKHITELKLVGGSIVEIVP